MHNVLKLANGTSINLKSRGEEYLGLGDVRVHGVSLRNDARPMFIDIRNPWGVHLCDYRLKNIESHEGGYRLAFGASREESGMMEWQLHECRPVRNVSDWAAPPQPAPTTQIELILLPITRQIGSRQYTGFSYKYNYSSTNIPIYYILDRSTWEVDGSARQNEFWMRQGNAPSLYKPESKAEHYSTEWYLPGCANSNILQFIPFQTHLQGFSMTAADSGILLTYSPKASHIRSLFEKPRNTDLFVHMHEHCGDLACEFATPPMEVLFSAGETNRIERANIYGDILDHVYDTLHADIGFRREYVPTWGQIEEGKDADLDLYRNEGLPALDAAGIKCVEISNHFQNDMNTWGLSNMCCTVDLKVADNVGEDKIQAFCDDAAKRGITVAMWGNTSISTTTVRFASRAGKPKRIEHLPWEGSIMQVLRKARRPFVRNSFGAIEADHYTPRFCVLNLRDPVVREYWLKCWGKLHDELGMTGIFLDSSFNLSSDKFDWRFNADPQAAGGATVDQTHLLGNMRPSQTPPSSIESQYHAHLQLMAEMQRIGYLYCTEDSGVFGVHRNGPDIAARLDNLFLWREFIAVFNIASIRKAGADPDDIFFKGLAYRQVWTLKWNIESRKLSFLDRPDEPEDERPRQWHFELYKCYNTAEPHMRRREIMPGEKGVLYTNGNRRVLWAFENCRLPLQQTSRVQDVLSGDVFETAALEAQKHRVYLIG